MNLVEHFIAKSQILPSGVGGSCNRVDSILDLPSAGGQTHDSKMSLRVCSHHFRAIVPQVKLTF